MCIRDRRAPERWVSTWAIRSPSRLLRAAVLLDRDQEAGMLFVGDDWAEDHHDVEIVDETGRTLARRRFPEGLAGITRLHALIAEHLPEPAGSADPAPQVVVGIETERGPWAAALVLSLIHI